MIRRNKDNYSLPNSISRIGYLSTQMIFSKILRPSVISFRGVAAKGGDYLLSARCVHWSGISMFAVTKPERVQRQSKEQSYTAFLFDEEGKTPIFEHVLGEVRLGVKG